MVSGVWDSGLRVRELLGAQLTYSGLTIEATSLALGCKFPDSLLFGLRSFGV